jgi:hypothetical protein
MRCQLQFVCWTCFVLFLWCAVTCSLNSLRESAKPLSCNLHLCMTNGAVSCLAGAWLWCACCRRGHSQMHRGWLMPHAPPAAEEVLGRAALWQIRQQQQRRRQPAAARMGRQAWAHASCAPQQQRLLATHFPPVIKQAAAAAAGQKTQQQVLSPPAVRASNSSAVRGQALPLSR